MRAEFTKIGSKLQNSSLPYQLFQVFRYGFLLLVSVALTRIYDEQTVIRQYELLLLLGGSLSFFWVTGLYDGFLVAWRQALPEHRPTVLLHTFALAAGLSLLSAAATWAAGTFLLPGRIPAAALTAYSLYLLFDLSSHLLAYLLIGRRSGLALPAYGFIVYLLHFLVICIPLACGAELAEALAILAGLAGLKFLLLLAVARKDLARGLPEKRILRTLVHLGGPLAAAALLSHSAQYVDGYLVEHFFPGEFTVFRYGAKELPLVLLLANSMSVVRSGDLAEGLREGDASGAFAQLRRSARRLTHTMFPLSILLLAFSTPLFIRILGPDFAGAVPVFDLYLLLVVPRLLFPQSVLRGYGRTYVMTFSAAVELVLNVALSLLFMRFWGIAGIAAATVIAYAVEKLVLAVYCRRKLGLRFTSYAPAADWLGWSAAMALAWALKYLVL